ncbi:MAG: DUF4382 domain-containing protein [Caldimonas sp.]
MNIRSGITRALAATLLLILAACGGGGGTGGGGGIGGTGSPSTLGTLDLSLSDAPACGYDAVNVTVQKVRVHGSSSAVDNDSGWSEVVLNPARRVDLLTLTNGVLESLGQTTLPPGKYTQLRFVLAPNDGANPFANSVVPTGGNETALTTPSGTQTGIKVDVDIDVVAGQTTSVVLDFNACKSVVRRGNSGQYNLKPVISATTLSAAAGLRVVGYVAPSIALATTSVSVQSAGVPVKATLPDANGRFVLYPVPAGTYDLVVTSAGHSTAVITGVPVTAAAITTLNGSSLPITPPTATLRTVTGTVVPATATVRALQAFSGSPTVETAWAPVDATTGAFSLAVPIDAPLKTGYVANPVSLPFVQDATAAGRYTIEATSNGVVKTLTINTSVSQPLPLSFSFP